MRGLFATARVTACCALLAFSSCAVQEEAAKAPSPPPPSPAAKAAPAEKAPEKVAEKKEEAKAKPIKAKGDVGLLDLEKNYMILVTKEGKLITVDFDQKAKVTKIEPTPSKMEEIGLGSSAVAEYVTQGEKKILTAIEFRPAKAGE
jgi:glucose/arabinose dehydrogenase